MRVAVTDAFGYSGKYIARRLLAEAHEVIALTNSVQRANPFGKTLPNERRLDRRAEYRGN